MSKSYYIAIILWWMKYMCQILKFLYNDFYPEDIFREYP